MIACDKFYEVFPHCKRQCWDEKTWGWEDLGRRLVTSLHAAVLVIETKLLPLSIQIFWYYRGALSSSLMWYIFVQCAFFFFQCVTTDIFAWYESTTVIRTDWTTINPNCTFPPTRAHCSNKTNGTNGTLGLWRTSFNKNYFYSMNDTVFTEMFTIIDYGYLLTCIVDFMLLCTPYCCQYLFVYQCTIALHCISLHCSALVLYALSTLISVQRVIIVTL